MAQPDTINGTASSANSYQPVRAPRGTALTCKGWQQEAALRMLMNNLDPDVAERPQELDHLRRHGQGGAQLGLLPRHRCGAEGSRK